MVEGDQWELTIPSEMAYGESESPPKIPGGSVLVFKIEIIKINGDKVDAVRCDPESGDGCNEKELKFIDVIKKKFSGAKESKMKESVKNWLDRRINIVKKLWKDEL